jgi:hypothetical protein
LAVAFLFHHRNYYEFIQNDPAIWLISFRRAGEDKKTLVLRVGKKQSIDGGAKQQKNHFT